MIRLARGRAALKSAINHMTSWPGFIEQQKYGLMSQKDKWLLPLVKVLAGRVRPDHLTFFRFCLALILFLFWQMQIGGLIIWTGIFYLLAKFTDWLDGALARYLNKTTVWGGQIDLLADKVFYLAGFFILTNLWPGFLAFHFIFIIEALAVIIVLINGLSLILIKKINQSLRMLCRLLEGLAYGLALMMFLLQIFL